MANGGYVSGETQCPEATNVKTLRLWKTENSMVCSWLVNSMALAVKKSFLFLPIAQEIWDAVKEAYSDGENASQVFEIKSKLWLVKQGNHDPSEYYLEKTAL